MGKLTPEQAAKNRERQKKWRENAFNPDKLGLSRVNLAISIHAANALKRLSGGYGLTQRDLIERLLSAADSEIAETIGHDRQAAYYDGKLESGALGAFNLTVKREAIPLDANISEGNLLACNTNQDDATSLDANDSDSGKSLDANEKKKTGRKPKLSPEQCDEIRLRRERGDSVADLAKAFGVAQNTIRSAINQEVQDAG